MVSADTIFFAGANRHTSFAASHYLTSVIFWRAGHRRYPATIGYVTSERLRTIVAPDQVEGNGHGHVIWHARFRPVQCSCAPVSRRHCGIGSVQYPDRYLRRGHRRYLAALPRTQGHRHPDPVSLARPACLALHLDHAGLAGNHGEAPAKRGAPDAWCALRPDDRRAVYGLDLFLGRQISPFDLRPV